MLFCYNQKSQGLGHTVTRANLTEVCQGLEQGHLNFLTVYPARENPHACIPSTHVLLANTIMYTQ